MFNTPDGEPRERTQKQVTDSKRHQRALSEKGASAHGMLGVEELSKRNYEAAINHFDNAASLARQAMRQNRDFQSMQNQQEAGTGSSREQPYG